MRRTINVATFLLLAFSLVPFSLGEVVYDSLPFQTGGNGINAGGTTGNESGNSIRLSGDSRQVTQFELGLSANGPGGFRIKFYELDGTGGTPGSIIWQSPIQIYPYEPGAANRKVVTVAVPSITVPDLFAWTVRSEVPAANMLLMSSATAPPNVGESIKSWERGSDSVWRNFSINTGVYAARINAVPEPSTLLLLGIGAISLLGYRKAKSHG